MLTKRAGAQGKVIRHKNLWRLPKVTVELDSYRTCTACPSTDAAVTRGKPKFFDGYRRLDLAWCRQGYLCKGFLKD
jgi:hypothetical protein